MILLAVYQAEDHNGLDARQLRAIAAMLEGKNIKEAAKAAGVARRTLHAWMQDGAFVAELRKQESDLLDNAVRRLLRLQGKAMDALEGILDSDDVSAATRLRAVSLVLDNLTKLRELRLSETRVAELEALVMGDG